MSAKDSTKMRPSAKRVIAAMREVRLANREITTRNIAEQLGLQTQVVGANLQRMLKEGLVRRHGMVLQFDGGNRAKNMLWRINTLLVRELEKNERCQEVETSGSPSAMLALQKNTGAGEFSENKVRNAC